MAPKTVYSWVESIRDTKSPEPYVEYDEDVSIASADEEATTRDWETAKAKAILEGKYHSFDDDRRREDVDHDNWWRSISPEQDISDPMRISGLPAAQYDPELTPERLRPTRQNVSKLARELSGLTPAPRRPERSDSTKLRRLHTSQDSFIKRSLTSPRPKEQSGATTFESTLVRAASEPTTPSRTWRSSSRGASLQPSDVPYRISWLWPSHFGCSDVPSEIVSEPAISRLFNGPNESSVDHFAGIRVDFIRESRAPGIEHSSDPRVASHQRNETLTPEDSISSFTSNEFAELPVCIPLDIYRPHDRRQTLVPEDSISYCPSRSTHNYLYELPAARVTLKRISIPPPATARSERRAQDNTTKDPISPSIGRNLISTNSKSPPQSYDMESAQRRTLSAHHLPQGHKPEPQNGTMAWLHAIAGFLVTFNCWGLNNSFGLFQAYYETQFLLGTSPSAIAWIGSTQICLCFALGVPVGRMVDKGRFRLVFVAGTIIMLLGLFSGAWCTQLWNLWLCQGLISGVGMGMIFCSGTVVLMTWFDEQHVSIAMAMGAAGSCVGGIVYVLVTQQLLATLGFANTMRILGGIAAATMIMPLIVFRVRGQQHKKIRHDQNRSGLHRPSSTATTIRSFFEPSYLLAVAGLFFAFLGVYFTFVYVVSYGSAVLHLTDTQSTNLLIFVLAANLPGRFLPALISDKCIGPLNTIIPAAFLSSAVVWLWIAGTTTYASLIVIACFYGFVSAGIQVLYASTVYSFCIEPKNARPQTPNSFHDPDAAAKPRAPPDHIGIKAGGIFTCIGIGCLVGTPIGGALISYRTKRGLEQPYLYAQIFAGVCLFLGGVLLLASRVKKVGWTAARA